MLKIQRILGEIVKIVLVVLIAIVFVFMVPNESYAAENQDTAQEFVVATSLKSIGEIDKQIGTYELDFWFSMYSEGRDLLNEPPPEIDFINGRNIDFSSQYLGSNIFEERVQGTFVGEMDFHDFPFEKIKLQIQLEPATPMTTEHVILSIDPASGIDETANVPGWFISEPTFTVVENDYNNGDIYSRYIAEYVVERSPIGIFLKIILPVLIVVGISFVAYIIPRNYEVVAALALLPLVAVVFLHINALNELPPLGYLTIFDKIMIISYAMIANNVICTGRQVRSDEFSSKESAWSINNFHLKLSPIIGIAVGIVLFIGIV